MAELILDWFFTGWCTHWEAWDVFHKTENFMVHLFVYCVKFLQWNFRSLVLSARNKFWTQAVAYVISPLDSRLGGPYVCGEGQTYRILKFILGSFGLEWVLLTDGSILDPYAHIWSNVIVDNPRLYPVECPRDSIIIESLGPPTGYVGGSKSIFHLTRAIVL